MAVYQVQIWVTLKQNTTVALGGWERTMLKPFFPLLVIMKNCLEFGVTSFADLSRGEVKRYESLSKHCVPWLGCAR